jgi:lipoprotein-releasing system permease protein
MRWQLVRIALRFLIGAGRSATAGRMRSGFIGVGLSLVPLVVVLQVSDGMIQGITDRFIEAGTYHVQGLRFDVPREEAITGAAERLGTLPSVRSVTAERRANGLLYSDTSRSGVTIRAVSADAWAQDPGLRRYLQEERGSFDLSDPQNIIIGAETAESLGVDVGEQVRLLTVRSLGGDSVLPRVSRFQVAGVVSTGYTELDRLWVYVSLERGMEILPPDAGRVILGVKVERPYALSNELFGSSDPRYTASLLGELRGAVDEGYRFFTWYTLERSRYLSFRTTKNVLLLIMALIVVVASINISSALGMLYLDKQPEIAILKSMGVSPAQIGFVFLCCGMFVGAVGAAFGIAIGLLISVHINQLFQGVEVLVNAVLRGVELAAGGFIEGGIAPVTLLSAEFYLQEIPITLRLGDLWIVAAATIAFATVVAALPARRAARLRPLDILRRH